MAEYESRVRTVEAWLLSEENVQEVAQLSGGQVGQSRNAVTDEPIVDIRIPTMGGLLQAEVGEYVYRSSAGTWHKMTAAAFEATYQERIESPPQVENLDILKPLPRRI